MNFSRLISSLVLAVAGGLFAFSLPPAKNSLTPFCDMQAAVDYCDAHALQQPEGIWLYPDDNVIVLIAQKQHDQGNPAAPSFDIIVVETPDCMLSTGQIIGGLSRLADNKSYKLWLYTRKKGLDLVAPGNCLATLVDDGRGLVMKKPSVKIYINSLSLLPKFWRLVKIKLNNPMDKAPRGMIKLYPNPDGTPPGVSRLLYF